MPKAKFITLDEYLNSSTEPIVGKKPIDPVLLNEILMESISSEDFAKALDRLVSLNFSTGAVQQVNEDRGRLKRLVGKEPDTYLDSADTKKIGLMIANMDGTNRRDYMGIINFLGASCRIHHELKEAYIEEVRSQRQDNRQPQLSDEDLAAISKAEAAGRAQDDKRDQERLQKEKQRELQSKGVGDSNAQEETQYGRS